MSDLDTLSAVPLFAGLSDPQLEAVHAVMREHRVPASTVVLREGERGSSLFILVDGEVETTKQLGLTVDQQRASRQKVLVRLEAPQFFGEIGLLEDVERSATVTTIRDSTLLEITREDFEGLAEADVHLGYHVARNIAAELSARLRRADRDIVKLTAALSLALGNR